MPTVFLSATFDPEAHRLIRCMARELAEAGMDGALDLINARVVHERPMDMFQPDVAGRGDGETGRVTVRYRLRPFTELLFREAIWIARSTGDLRTREKRVAEVVWLAGYGRDADAA